MTIITAIPGTTWTHLVHFLIDKLINILKLYYIRIIAIPGTIKYFYESRFLNKKIYALQQYLEHFLAKKRIVEKILFSKSLTSNPLISIYRMSFMTK